MVVSCSAYNCKNRYHKSSHVKFHRFPLKNDVLLTQWLLAVKRKDFYPTKNSFLCSNHFKDDDYNKRGNIKNWRLKHNAVPSMFDFPALIQEAFNVPSTTHITKLRTKYPVINIKPNKRKFKEQEEEMERNVIDYVVNTYNEAKEKKSNDSGEPSPKKQCQPNEITKLTGRNTVLLQYISDKMNKVEDNLQILDDISSNVQWIEDVYNNMNMLSLIDECNEILKKINT